MREKNKEWLKFVCDKCAKEQKHDEVQSNENWKIYPNVPCECGGNFKPKIL